ncbi:MAG: tetratricopeptide repeat protein [Pseudomonadota bacterium]
MNISRHPRHAVAVAALALLLGACSTAPKSTPEAALPESNEPDLVAQLRERMAAGNLQRKAKVEQPGSTAVAGDTSSAPKVSIDPALQLAAQAVAPDYARATGLMQAGNDAEALALLRDIATRAPRFAGPLLNQGVILLRQQKHAEAEAVLREALKANPASPFAQNLLGIALRQQGKFSDARAAYTAALALDPDYARAHFNLGVLLDMYLQELPQALRHYERYQALQSKPDPAVANWIVDLQKRTGVYKAPPRPAPTPVPAAEGDAESAPAASGSDATPAPATAAPGESA